MTRRFLFSILVVLFTWYSISAVLWATATGLGFNLYPSDFIPVPPLLVLIGFSALALVKYFRRPLVP